MQFEEIIQTIGKKPYYQEDAVVIYHADCRDILPLIPDDSIDLVLTDPPYVGLGSKTTIMPIGGVGKHYTETKTVGDLWDANYDWLKLIHRIARCGVMVFGSYHNIDDIPKLVPFKKIALITWYKRNSPPSRQNAPYFLTEYVWAFAHKTGLNWHNLKTFYDIPKLATGCMASAERFVDKNGIAVHPTQKPEELICELLKVEPKTVLDPFVGTGTVSWCAKKLGMKCIAIEIEEKYCEIAAKRCSQSVMRLETNDSAISD